MNGVEKYSEKYRFALTGFATSLASLFALAIILLTPSMSAAKEMRFPDKPARSTFVVDDGELLSSAEERQISDIARALLKDERITLYVVTSEPLSKRTTGFVSIETYAKGLFNEWGIGYKGRNRGMLLLVSKTDRRARIELGADWGIGDNRDAQRIMDAVIIPHFKAGDFSGGIVKGAENLDLVARGLMLESAYYAPWVVPTLAFFAFLSLFAGISLVRSGRKGVGWLLITVGIAMLTFILNIIYNSFIRDSAHNGFGGGFSGGGGASGSW